MTIYTTTQRKIAEKLAPQSASLTKWKDWRWQLKHSVRSIDEVERLLGINFDVAEKACLKSTLERFPLSVTPYYLSLIAADDYRNDPVFMQAFPSSRELEIERHDLADPLSEDKDSPAPGITHRYPDRVLLHISNICAMYCRHCTRKRKVGDVDSIPDRSDIRQALDYIRRTPVIRDVLLSGGDPLMLSDDYLDWVLTELRKIPHVQIVRIGTRMPVVLPYRITPELVAVLKKHHPLWLNTHFNHPREITTSSRQALQMLADAGIPLGNQTVLLAGINDCPRIIKSLVQNLVVNRVRPYYLYQCDLAEGLAHFRTPVGKGIEIMESLIGHTSGFAVPTYVVDAPGGGRKDSADAQLPDFAFDQQGGVAQLRRRHHHLPGTGQLPGRLLRSQVQRLQAAAQTGGRGRVPGHRYRKTSIRFRRYDIPHPGEQPPDGAPLS